MNLFAPTWFLEGFWHPPQTPSQLILILALAVLTGQQNHPARLKVIATLAGSVCIGLVLNQIYLPDWNVELMILIIAIVISLLVTLRLTLPMLIISALEVLSGIILGLDSSPITIPGFGNEVMYNWLAGALLSMLLIFTLFYTISHFLRHLINGVVLRVVGSWIATSAIFVLTLMMVKV